MNMAKTHTRDQRWRVCTLRDNKKKKRPKTFKTEESANKWAEANKLKDYKLVNLRSASAKDKKIRVVC